MNKTELMAYLGKLVSVAFAAAAASYAMDHDWKSAAAQALIAIAALYQHPPGTSVRAPA